MASGHSGAMGYSIEQVRAFSFLADRRRKRSMSADILAALLGNRGDHKKVEKLIKEWSS